MKPKEIIPLFIHDTHLVSTTIGNISLKEHMKMKYLWSNQEWDKYHGIYIDWMLKR